MKVTLYKRHWPDTQIKPHQWKRYSDRADRAAAARKPHQWKRSLMET